MQSSHTTTASTTSTTTRRRLRARSTLLTITPPSTPYSPTLASPFRTPSPSPTSSTFPSTPSPHSIRRSHSPSPSAKNLVLGLGLGVIALSNAVSGGLASPLPSPSPTPSPAFNTPLASPLTSAGPRPSAWEEWDWGQGATKGPLSGEEVGDGSQLRSSKDGKESTLLAAAASGKIAQDVAVSDGESGILGGEAGRMTVVLVDQEGGMELGPSLWWAGEDGGNEAERGLPEEGAQQSIGKRQDSTDDGDDAAATTDDSASTTTLTPTGTSTLATTILANASATSSSSTAAPLSTLTLSASTSAAATTTLPLAPSSAVPMPTTTPYPTPADDSVSYDLGTSCVAFLSGYLESDELKTGGCGKAFGLLMSTSEGWLEIENNLTTLNTALSDMCYPSSSETDCVNYYSGLATEMQSKSNCASDLSAGNLVAEEILYGFQNYEMMQKAACLVDASTGVYCYIEALTINAPDDGYLYNLPEGVELPTTTDPTCSSCSRSLLSLYTSTVANSSATYASVLPDALTNATAIVNGKCGSGFISALESSHSSAASSWRLGTGRLALGAAMGVLGSLVVLWM